jgi:GntR family transcriptional regulator, arabinose operon transcriptional repressor
MPQPASAKPMYRKIRERLQREIAGGRYSPGRKFPSEAALVQRFGASRITVGRAVRELQELGLLDRVAGSGTYVRGTGQRPGEGLLFGLVIPNLGETEIFEPICAGLAASPEARGHGLLWAHADQAVESREEQAIELARYCIARHVAGVFFAPLECSAGSAEANARVIKLLHGAGVAVVLLDRRPDDSGARQACDLVGIDNRRAGYLAAEHLLRLGARRVGFVRLQGQASTVKARVRGYQDALTDFAAAGRVFTMRPHQPMVWNAAARDCDAFVCANDRVAGRWMQTLLGQRVRIPRDVGIVGIDDVNYASLLPVPLTTVHQPCREIGEAALRVMLERLERPRMAARDVLLDCTLVIRQSCGAKVGSQV